MQQLTRAFYRFLGLHSLLIGIFPFFIPVFLWKHGFEIGEVSLFIGTAGIGFALGLWIWDRLRHAVTLTTLIGVSLVLELLLLLNVQILGMNLKVLLLLGVSYGAYNSFFWTTQRALFFERVDTTNSGRRYGNLQIYVGFLLQVGIVVGGVLLEQTGFRYILVSSAILCAIGFTLFSMSKPVFPEAVNNIRAVTLRDIFTFRDSDASRTIFFIDGIYLFLESFFWVISLFLLAHESFAELGFMVLSLAVIFGIIFYLLKNTIDRLGRRRIYKFSVLLYAFSWALRAVIDNEFSLLLTYIALISITFCTSFFRLAMNKRFYDIARETLSHRYLVLKSYYTQVTITLVFLGFGFFALDQVDSEQLLSTVYWIAAAGSLTYLLYGADRYKAH